MQHHERAAAPEAAAPVVVALAASTGGVAALSAVLSGLPPDFPAPVLVVLHIPRERRSHLVQVLALRTPLRVAQAEDGRTAEPGTVYVAPPDRHLLLRPDGSLALSDAPAEHHSRPSANPLFRSLAEACGAGAVAVVLTGRDSDGAEGVRALAAAGGTVIAQDPATALAPGMPESAIATGHVQRVLPLSGIAAALTTLAHRGAPA